ncbi:MAG TPA: preprotein translocase subunit SecG [Parcubacteria group bacterium]|nr:preprotein translocase subunit SecG [Parcubacteria group bacterium]
MTNILPYIQAVLSVVLVVAILLQRSDASLGSAFGNEQGNTKFTRRGFEKFLFNATIVIAILFAVSAILSLFYRS